ncbi:hypothetical protein N7U66_00100 [Lacinutrix neustonica]|uniref:Uncharacterized protein n=1 Tax=Lacinutrix neustonica TaxID=2980107 RepID=A0A9E8MX85_9FLAO|nr:hypothetical protein [Lacinutrix neustonica]WAC02232.1 hypothetical protein N7U66_00100 [Lacinutrix neustonica]
MATIVGSIIGYGITALIPFNVGTAISLGIAMLVINFISGFKKSWRYGVVAAVAIALGSESNLLDTSMDRLISIGIGVAIGTLITFIIRPDKAEDRANRFLRDAIRAANKRFNVAITNTRYENNKDGSAHANIFHKNINYAQDMLNATQFADKSNIQDRIDHTKNLYNSIIIIHRVGEESHSNITNGSSNIEQDSKTTKTLVSDILNRLANGEKVEQDIIIEFSDQIETLIDNVQMDHEDKTITMLRQTFVFGLTEMKQSLEHLVGSYN